MMELKASLSTKSKKELLPVLAKGERFNVKDTVELVIAFVKELFVLDENELDYLKEFSKGNYYPTLLFDEKNAAKISAHPMAKWRASKILMKE